MPLARNTQGIARIVVAIEAGDCADRHVGMAIVIDERHVMTCCHVLNDALGRASRLDPTPPPQDDLFDVDFPYAANARRTGRVTHWGLALQPARDVAIIELSEDSPSEA